MNRSVKNRPMFIIGALVSTSVLGLVLGVLGVYLDDPSSDVPDSPDDPTQPPAATPVPPPYLSEMSDEMAEELREVSEEWHRQRREARHRGLAREEQPEEESDEDHREMNDLSRWEGFRGIRWGTDISDMAEMVLIDRDEEKAAYLSREDHLTIGGAELKSIKYLTYKDHLYSVKIRAKNADWRAFRDAVFATFGEGQRPRVLWEEWYWNREDVLMFLELCSASKTKVPTLYMVYEPIVDQIREDRAQRAREAARDF